ncbi:MAG: hypothetical protein ABIN89_25645 [Chitinophagaceae bacterium]
MIKFVQEAKRNLPVNISKGTIIKVPVNITTGKFVKDIENKDGPDILFYGFIKIGSGWQFLGRGLTA